MRASPMPWHQGRAIALAMSREGGMKILMALAVMMLVATPAFAGHKNNRDKLDRQIDNLQNQIDHVLLGPPSDDRREQIDKLEGKLAFKLFQRNKLDE